MVLAREIVTLDYCIGRCIGSSLLSVFVEVKNRFIGKRSFGLRKALLLVAGSFAASATDAASKVNKNTIVVRIFFNIMGLSRFRPL